MTYSDLMKKIVALPGWTWKWTKWDKAYDTHNDDICLVRRTPCDDDSLLSVLGGSLLDGDYLMSIFIPLPTVEQWQRKFLAECFATTIRCMHDGRYCIDAIDMSTIHDGRSSYILYEDDQLYALAILYARVALNLEWNEEKGEFESRKCFKEERTDNGKGR